MDRSRLSASNSAVWRGIEKLAARQPTIGSARCGFRTQACESAWKIDPHLGDIGVEK
jgi:hypothetical protein